MYSVDVCLYPYFQLQIIVIHDGFLFLQLVLIRMGVDPMGGGEKLVYRSTYCEPAMECAWRNMSMALSWFAYLPLLCSKFLGQGLYIKYQS